MRFVKVNDRNAVNIDDVSVISIIDPAYPENSPYLKITFRNGETLIIKDDIKNCYNRLLDVALHRVFN